MYEASLELLNNTDSYKSSTYFITWGYQMGHVLYQTILLHIINSVTFLKIVNSIITSFTVVFIYLIAQKVTSKQAAKIASILYSIFLFPLLLNTVLTNQHLPVLLILISIYLLLNINYDKYISKSLIIGLLIGLSNILRSEGIVIIFSIFLYSLFLVLKKYNIKKILLSFLLIIFSYFLIFNTTSLILEKTAISPNGLNNMNPTWKFVLGFNYETNGMYSETDAIKYSQDSEKSKEIVKERLKDYKKIPLLFIKKIKVLWFNSDLSWSIGNIYNQTIYKVLNIINQIFIIIFSLLSALSIVRLIRTKFSKISNTQMITTLILIVYFGAYLLIEVMPRYAYSLQVFEAILMAISIDYILKLLTKKHKN